MFAAVTAPCAPFAALVAFAVPFRTAARKLARTGSAIAGWSGASDIGRSKHLIVTDKDLFTARNISIESIRILGGAFPARSSPMLKQRDRLIRQLPCPRIYRSHAAQRLRAHAA